jgi:hypothetical protein
MMPGRKWDYTVNKGKPPPRERTIDVAIVGAGISGLYSGWRLRTGKFTPGADLPIPPRTHVFELSDRIGGRLLTTFLEGMPNVRCELGGMRYIRATPAAENPLPGHQMVHNLGRKLGLEPIVFPMGDGNTLYYLRRQRLWTNDIKAGVKLPYDLKPWEQKKTDDDLFNEMVKDVLDKNRNVILNKIGVRYPRNRREWNKVKPFLQFQGRPTYLIGFWNLLSNYLSGEAYLYLQDINGYDSNTLNWSAGEALQAQTGDFEADTKYYTFQEGYDGLVHGTAELFCKHGGKIWVKNRLVTFSRKGGYLKLTFFNEKDAEKGEGEYYDVFAKVLVLAMPRRSLELLDQTNFFFNDLERPAGEKILPYIQSVIIMPAFKLYLGYDRPWWEELKPGLFSGRTITDLPTRQVYYFGTEPQSDSEPRNTNSLLMAAYTDEWAADFWRPLEEDRPRVSYVVPGRYSDAADRRRRPDGFRPRHAPQLMVDYTQKQLQEIHGDQIRIPEPYISAFYDWGDNPFGGGYHGWAASVQVRGADVPSPWKAATRMRQPVDGVPVHVCGEAYSDQQGWVEGALCTAERMLQDHFHMEYPYDWLPRDYYFGW